MSGQADFAKRFQEAQRESMHGFDSGALKALLQPAPCNRFYIQALPDRATIVFGAVGPVNDSSNMPVACSTVTSSILVTRQMGIDLCAILAHVMKISDEELAESRKRNANFVGKTEIL